MTRVNIQISFLNSLFGTIKVLPSMKAKTAIHKNKSGQSGFVIFCAQVFRVFWTIALTSQGRRLLLRVFGRAPVRGLLAMSFCLSCQSRAAVTVVSKVKKERGTRAPATSEINNLGRLSKGNDLKVVALQGTVVLECNGFQGSVSQTYFCRDQIIDSGNYDYFVGPTGTDADEVRISAEHADGTYRNVKSDYQSSRGRSEDSFNLWVSTLFQKPLLKEGKNVLRWILMQSRSGKELAANQFTVNVTRAGVRTCQPKHYQSIDALDCRNQYSICQKYFSEMNYCR